MCAEAWISEGFVCGCLHAATAENAALDKFLPFVNSVSPLFIFQEAHVFINAEKVEDVTEERIRADLNKAQASTSTQWVRRSSRSSDKEELVVSGLQYLK